MDNLPKHQPAGFSRILGAMFYDTFVLIGLLIALTAMLLPLTDGEAISSGNPLYQTFLLFILFGFYAFFWLRGGQTVGMLAWQIKIISTRGKRVTLWQALLRFFVAFLGIGNLWIFFDNQKRSWQDIYSETQIIRKTDD
jgi:uncharacterized RDD family membrane protein YckC